MAFPGDAVGKPSACQCRRYRRQGFDPWIRKIPWSRKWQPILVLLPGKFHRQRLCLTLCNPMDYSPPVSSVQGIFQERILEWVAISFSRGFSQPRDRTQVSCTAGGFFTLWVIREAPRRQSDLDKREELADTLGDVPGIPMSFLENIQSSP